MGQWLPKVLLCLLVPIYGAYILSPAVGYMHDDGVYLVTSRALASGHGYVVESLPAEIPQTKYPILYPAILTLIWKLAGELSAVVLLAKLFSLACSACWLVVIRRWLLKTLDDQSMVDWIVFFTAAAPWTIYLSVSVLPDTLFALLSTAAALLLLRDGSDSAGIGRSDVAVAGMLAAAAFLIRTAGIALIVASAIFIWRRNARHAFLFLGICALLCAPWLIWQAAQPAPSDGVQLYYSKLSYAKGHILAGYDWRQVLSVVLLNAVLLSATLEPSFRVLPTPLTLLVCGVGTGLAIMGWYRGAQLRGDVLSIWVLFYTGILLCWVWPPARYVAPVIPIFLLFLAQQTKRLQWSPRGRWVAKTALAFCGVAALITSAAGAVKTTQLGVPVNGLAEEAERWKEGRELAEWLRTSTPPAAVVSGNLDPMLYLYSERKAIRPFKHSPFELFYQGEEGPSPVGTAEDIRSHLRNNRISYVVLSPMKGFREGEPFLKAFAELRHKSPGAFRLLKELPRPGYAIYGVDVEAL